MPSSTDPAAAAQSPFQRRAGLEVATPLVDFLEGQALPGVIDAATFWPRFEALLRRFTPVNRALLATRERLQAALDAWHRANPGPIADMAAYRAMLSDIGWLAPEPGPFTIATTGVDDEIAQLAGPQLVVPAMNARFVLNAANARWGSLYDALYGTDALDAPPARPGAYDIGRGAAVVAEARCWLDRIVPLADGSWADWDGGAVKPAAGVTLVGQSASAIICRHHGLHVVICIDADHPVGRRDKAGISDILIEAALTAIVDLEDSVAAVDADDKVQGYASWLGLMRGDLTESFSKNGSIVERRLADDRCWTLDDGSELVLPGRSVLFVRNVGHLMTTPMVRLDGEDAFEGLCDAVITSLIGCHDRARVHARNSRAGSIYIVKPKMHGPDECAFANDLFDAVEDLLGLPRHTVKIGVMDEERRTSANLAACIHAVRDRIVFINTGFLDRTGDEIHTAMHAGAMVPRAEMKAADWIGAYEQRNVAIALAAGFAGRAQIGKGMWAMPDAMRAMMVEKLAHAQSGASTAWVPSPTAATLHALHYHLVDVPHAQASLASARPASLDRLLTIPVATGRNWDGAAVAREVDNCCQSILGYVVRWVDQGIGCSKVADIDDVALMEDRATLRISSQALANWLLHGVCDARQVETSLRRMAAVVDRQNAHDPIYRPMAPDPDASLAFQAARALILEGGRQPSGYTEPLLTRYRIAAKGRG